MSPDGDLWSFEDLEGFFFLSAFPFASAASPRERLLLELWSLRDRLLFLPEVLLDRLVFLECLDEERLLLREPLLHLLDPAPCEREDAL